MKPTLQRVSIALGNGTESVWALCVKDGWAITRYVGSSAGVLPNRWVVTHVATGHALTLATALRPVPQLMHNYDEAMRLPVARALFDLLCAKAPNLDAGDDYGKCLARMVIVRAMTDGIMRAAEAVR